MEDAPRHLELRAAARSDAEAVTSLVFSALDEYGLAPDPEGTDADLGDLEGHYAAAGGAFDVLVDAAGGIVGCVGLRRIDAATCELRKMYLAKAARGRGLGRRLLDHALGRARALGFRRVVLETNTVLVEAIDLYRSRGFTPFEAERVTARCNETYVLDLA